jgi:hypothetical protein
MKARLKLHSVQYLLQVYPPIVDTAQCEVDAVELLERRGVELRRPRKQGSVVRQVFRSYSQ